MRDREPEQACPPKKRLLEKKNRGRGEFSCSMKKKKAGLAIIWGVKGKDSVGKGLIKDCCGLRGRAQCREKGPVSKILQKERCPLRGITGGIRL